MTCSGMHSWWEADVRPGLSGSYTCALELPADTCLFGVRFGRTKTGIVGVTMM